MCYSITVPNTKFGEKQMQEHDNEFIEDSKIVYDIEGTKDTTSLAALGRALSSPTRIQMIRLASRWRKTHSIPVDLTFSVANSAIMINI